MNTSLVVTVVGPDRPGLVERVSKVISSHGANWQQSRMVRLANKFAGVLLISVPDASLNALREELTQLKSSQLLITVETTDADTPSEPHRAFTLQLVGNDRPGIVREVSQVLANLNVNIEELSTSYRSAPMTGDPLFQAVASLQLPGDVSVEQVRASLERITADLMVDINVTEPTEPG